MTRGTFYTTDHGVGQVIKDYFLDEPEISPWDAKRCDSDADNWKLFNVFLEAMKRAEVIEVCEGEFGMYLYICAKGGGRKRIIQRVTVLRTRKYNDLIKLGEEFFELDDKVPHG